VIDMPEGDTVPGTSGTRRTARGLETRSRVVDSAAKLFYVKGVNATTLDDVRLASSTSSRREAQRLRGAKTLTGLRRWRDALVQANSLQDGSYGVRAGRDVDRAVRRR
jgi:TetR/AcrR family transcriptional repressor of nem operon